VTTEAGQSGFQISKTLQAVKEIGIQAVVLYPNNDAGTKKIIAGIKGSGIKFIRSLPPEVFSNVLRYCQALVGNSSSGIHEASTFHIPVVNIGTRQQGRQRPKNVIDAKYNKEEIKKAIKKALYNKNFKEIVKKSKNIYGTGHSAEKVVKILKKIDIKKIPLQKKFKD
jgi:UDP-N-acetylglucosamine 2-epimerase (non-hydrolysing)/GDP/UDP-N,N'-diacetylbacillosamine 2-epimerase (hydrolysing)